MVLHQKNSAFSVRCVFFFRFVSGIDYKTKMLWMRGSGGLGGMIFITNHRRKYDHFVEDRGPGVGKIDIHMLDVYIYIECYVYIYTHRMLCVYIYILHIEWRL